MTEELIADIREVEDALHLFLTDRYYQALDKMKPKIDSHCYHAVGNAFLHCMQAFLSFEPMDIECAIDVCKDSTEVCGRFCHASSITNNAVTKMVVRPNYETYTDLEIHAELCYADCLLLRTLLTFIQDDSLLSLVKGGLRIRTSFMTYKECKYILDHHNWKHEESRLEFESGVCLGLGMFNLVISTLPKRILKLLEFVGFSGDKDTAVELLNVGFTLSHTIRGPVCALLNLLYHMVIQYLLGIPEKNLEYFDSLLPMLNQKFPNGSYILFLTGRTKFCQGKVHEAIGLYKKAVVGEVEWNKFRQPSYWDLFFCNLSLGNYREALIYIDVLYRESNWSKAVYSYLKAITYFMIDDLSENECQDMVQLMQDVPSLKQRIVGKSLPVEKFVVMKAERFFAQNNWLVLPTFEMLYVLCYFNICIGIENFIDKVLVKVERALDELNEESLRESPNYMDNYCLALFLKGVCLCYLGSPLSAEDLFLEIIENQKSLKSDQYLVALALLELGLICIQTGNNEQAVEYLTHAKKHAMFYAEFRIHRALQTLEDKATEKNH